MGQIQQPDFPIITSAATNMCRFTSHISILL